VDSFSLVAWVGNGVPTPPWHYVVSLQSRLYFFQGRVNHAPFFLCVPVSLREVWPNGHIFIWSSFLAGVVQMSR